MKLTKEDNISKEFEFDGIVNILIYGGMGTVTLERKLNGSGWFPLSSDINGGIVQFEGVGEGAAYNGSLEERGLGAVYRFVADIDSGEFTYIISRASR
tara:strand:+ start:7346 stop:7639 length:294 start_codon:yes stop_codon:yes gene_type:complete